MSRALVFIRSLFDLSTVTFKQGKQPLNNVSELGAEKRARGLSCTKMFENVLQKT